MAASQQPDNHLTHNLVLADDHLADVVLDGVCTRASVRERALGGFRRGLRHLSLAASAQVDEVPLDEVAVG
ncbi:MAG: hypothetical protein NVSMB2_02350 [Chloroflexota bacterium]